MAKSHRSYERNEKTDLEYYRGLVRQLQKKVSSLEKENARLAKQIRQEEDRLVGLEYENDAPKSGRTKKEKKWICPECFHSEFTEMALPQGNVIKVYKICKNCGKKDKPTCRENMDINRE